MKITLNVSFVAMDHNQQLCLSDNVMKPDKRRFVFKGIIAHIYGILRLLLRLSSTKFLFFFHVLSSRRLAVDNTRETLKKSTKCNDTFYYVFYLVNALKCAM